MEWEALNPVIKVCNPTAGNLDDHTTDFNLPIIDRT